MSVRDAVLSANERYAASFGAKGELALPPARGFAVLTCMDARLDPTQYAGLSEGDAHVIRNAGGRASDDAIRSLVISYKSCPSRSGSLSCVSGSGRNWSESRRPESLRAALTAARHRREETCIAAAPRRIGSRS